MKDVWVGAGTAGNLPWALRGGWGGASLGLGEAESARICWIPPADRQPSVRTRGFSGCCADGEMEAWRVRGLPEVSHGSGRRAQWAQAWGPGLVFSISLKPHSPVGNGLFSPLFCRCNLNPASVLYPYWTVADRPSPPPSQGLSFI